VSQPNAAKWFGKAAVAILKMTGRVYKVDLRAADILSAVLGELSPAQLGLKQMIELLILSRGGPIPDDPDWLRGKFKRSPGLRTLAGDLNYLVETGCVCRARGELSVSWCLAELECASSRILASVENGSRGGRPKQKNNDLEKPSGLSGEKPPPPPPETPSLQAASHEAAFRESGAARHPTRAVKRLDENWCPDDAGVEFAKQLGLDPVWAADMFRDYWLAEASPRASKKDWGAAWRRWCRREVEYRGGHQTPPESARGADRPAPPRLTPEQLRVEADGWRAVLQAYVDGGRRKEAWQGRGLPPEHPASRVPAAIAAEFGFHR
jgi:hypothetical protein